MIKKITTAIVALLATSSLNYAQSTRVVPPGCDTAAGGSSFTGPLANSGRSYQMLIDSTMISNLLNNSITGIAFRVAAASTAAWPTADITYNNYDIYVGKSILIQNATNTFESNQSGTQTQVRSGSLVIHANDYPAAGVNSWGPTIQFNSGYNYTGGNVSILIRHNGSNGASVGIDAVPTTANGYNSLFKACWQGSYTGTGTNQGNFSALRISYGSSPLPVTLTSFVCSSSGYDARINWETVSEKNMKSFTVESSLDGIKFQEIYTLPVQSESNTKKQYTHMDYNVFRKTQTVFYRLKMVEADGSFKYSNVNKVNVGKEHSANLIVYPNPVTSIGNISYNLSADAAISCRIYNIMGREVYSDVFKSLKGNNAILTDLSHLKKGSYILTLSGDGIEDFYRFVKD